MEREERFALYRKLIGCKYPLCFWRYDSKLELQETNCTDVHLWQRVFEGSGTLDALRAHCAGSDRPILLDTMLGVLWGAVCAGDAVYVIGPVMGLEGNLNDMEESVRGIIEAGIRQKGAASSLEFRYRLTDAFKQLPVVSTIDFCNDIAMLHCCLTDEEIRRESVEHLHRTIEVSAPAAARRRDRHQTWMAEQAILRMVREGDLNYKKVLAHAANVSRGVPVEAKDPMQKARFSGITFVTLCTRAAIEGGLTPEQAYTVGDIYVQQIEDAQTVADMMNVNHAMYEDFITRVHNCRSSPRFSPQMQACRDYIELHLEEPLSLSALAKHTGYSEYYLSRRFKQELGVNISDYIRFARVERAKMLLVTTEAPIREIAARLLFCSGGYFADVFRQVVGMTPQDYRRQNQK